ncbi:hypothetical protein BZG36_05723 [Bifiguratus adelaidae]|uniref:Large ribosomal subunit protein mL50 n=1 Tax=Bifiguratus adelaidae TaxID=1938954 RepID=A0A261XSR7_9FUNG|nr:hypothetical protein BZG36_05723 [Bifiguratus adelaidae]
MTDEQKKKYLEPALRYEIIGCYAQTELGHGSNVQGLETTCTYHPESGEFELNSPTLTSSKWWIGGLGKAANHAIVMARLITNGKDYGPHPFIVQIRSLKDHTPLPGVTVGDIGPKLGYNTTDNGFLMFDHVRIPHFNMLAKYSKVDKKTGEYIRPPNAKLSYGTMVFIRANLVMGVRYALARATTIAIRYSAIRSQFVDAANPKKFNGKTVETPVIDYTMQQYRLFPHLAAAYACFFTGRSMMDLYHRNMKNMASGDFSLLADTHATSSGLKSLTTTMAAEAIEDCRRACGGHGYSLFSGLGSFYLDFLPNVTWEGDNYILTQQTARYLFKTFRNLASGKTNRNKETNFTISYLSTYLENPKKTCPITNGEQFLNPELILSSLGHRSAYLIAESVDLIDNKQRSWNSMLVNISRISRAHCQYVLVSNFWTALQSDERLRKNKPLYEAVRDLALLFSLNTLEKELADFLASGYITPAQAPLIKEQVIACLDRIRPNAVALVDAFSLPDYLLNSALGRYDGKVYEAMTSMAEREPLNSTLVVKGYEEHIRPLTPESTIEPTEKKDDRRINLADVDELRVGQYDDEIPSWRATTQETDPTVIRKMIETILSDLTSTESSNLSTDSVLSDPTLKFNLLKRAIKELGKEIPSHKLGQLTTVDEVIAYFTETETPPLRVRDLFEQEGAFPPNVRFEEKH